LPGDLSVTPVVPVWLTQSHRADASQATGSTPSTPDQSLGTNLATIPHPVNPDFHLDLALNIAVLQFFDAKGNVTQSIPSQKPLDAYRADDGVNSTHAAVPSTSQLL
jgi:hypothetical protein